MTNPKDPQVRREEGGPIVPIGALAADRGLPVDRFVRVGATPEVVDYLQDVWDSLDVIGREDWLDELDVMTDDELAAELDFTVEQRPDDAEPGEQLPGSVDAVTGEELPPAVEGKVVHEGGGWYSVWVDGTEVTDDTIRGRDAAEELLDDWLSGTVGGG